MKNLRLIALFLVCFVLVITSCKKKKGCTDPIAYNYNPSAKEDNGACTYGQVSFWSPSQQIYNILVYVDGYWKDLDYDPTAGVKPDPCEDRYTVVFNNPPGTYPYHAENLSGDTLGVGSVTFVNGICQLVKF